MPRADPVAAGREKKARSIIDFSEDLRSKLSDPRPPDLLLADIGRQITTVTALCQKVAPLQLKSKTTKDLERHGRDLWNLCIRLKREGGETTRNSRLLSRARLFAFHVLELGRRAGRAKRDDESEVVYLMSLAMTLGRVCLEGEDLDSTRAALQKAAEYIERLKALSERESDEYSRTGRITLEADYLSLRMALSCKEGCLDVAEHMFNKTETLRGALDTASAESMADTLRHIGSDCYSRADLAMAVKWSKRALDFINSQPIDRLSVEGLDTRLTICQTLVQSLLGLGTPEAISEANDLVSYVESEMGDKPIVLHWRLEILQRSPDEVFDAEIYASILRRMVRVFDFTDQTFHFLLHHIKEIRSKSSRLACGLLDELLTQRVLRSERIEWVGKALVRRVWMSTMAADTPEDDAILSILDILNTVRETILDPLSPDVAAAVQSLIWKKVESTIACKRYEIMDKWCVVALHDLLANCGEANRAKFGRKRILCAIGLNNGQAARAAFADMSEAAQDEPLTRYLMFKASLLDWDSELGCQCIEHLAKSVDQSRCQEMLYACVREAQQSGDKICTLAALKAVALRWDPVKSPASCLTSIIRGSIRLINLLEKDEQAGKQPDPSGLFSEDTCKLFELAAERAKSHQKDKDGSKIFTVPELNWFRKNAYNIGVTKCASPSWDLRNIVRIFNTCLDFISCYPSDIPHHDFGDIELMAIRCHFVKAAALVSVARAEDKIDERLQRYLETRQHVAAFDTMLENNRSEKQPEEVVQDLRRKMSTLSVFDFEGAVALKSWDDLTTIVRKADSCADESSLKAMGDCLLRSQAPGRVMYATMRLIINQIFKMENFDGRKLAKYVRCLFQATLPLDDSLALQLLKEALDIARQAAAGKDRSLFPQEDVEWLVATAFNHAVDFYARGEEDACHRWALAAMELTACMCDGGGLKDVLQEKFAKLLFGGRKQY